MTALFTNKSEIVQFLSKYNPICNYSIRDDLTVDIEGSIELTGHNWEYLPITFGTVTGDFCCSRNKLKSLKGCPSEVHGDFMCSENELLSLEYGPDFVGKDYYCYGNQLTTLEFIPKELNGDLIARDNLLMTLEGGPETMTGAFYLENNSVSNFKGAPRYIGKFIQCGNNPIVSLDDLTGKFTLFLCNNKQGFIEDIQEFCDVAFDGTYSISHHRLQNFLLYRRLFFCVGNPLNKQ